MSTLELLACIILLCCSAFLASSEIALFSLSRFHLRILRETQKTAYRKIKKLLSDPSGLLITVLVANEMVNIALSTLIASMTSKKWNALWNSMPQWISPIQVSPWVMQTIVSSFISAALILIFGEITPKIIAARASQLIAPMNISPLTLVYQLLTPVRLVTTQTMQAVTSVFVSKTARKTQAQHSDDGAIKEEEFITLVEEGHKEGNIQESELELIKNVFELDNTPVFDVCTPIQSVYSLPSDTPLITVLNQIRGKNFSRIPVIEKINGKIKVKGILYTKDLILSPEEGINPNTPISTIMRKPLFISSDTRLNTLFRKLKQQKTHMAIIENQKNETLGVVTMSDVLDALFDDLLNEDENGDIK